MSKMFLYQFSIHFKSTRMDDSPIELDNGTNNGNYLLKYFDILLIFDNCFIKVEDFKFSTNISNRVKYFSNLSNMLQISARFGDAAEMCNQLIILLSWAVMFVTFPFSLLFAIKWTQVIT